MTPTTGRAQPRAAWLMVAVAVAAGWVPGCGQSPLRPAQNTGAPGESRFHWTIAPLELTLTPGAKGTFTIRLDSKENINSDVSFSVESNGPLPGATWTITPQRLTSTARDAELTVQTTSQTPIRPYSLRITATEVGYGTHETAVGLHVVSADEPPDFALAVNPDVFTLTKGSDITIAFRVIPFNGFAGTVNVLIYGTEKPPAPVTVTSPTPNDFTFAPGDPERGGTFVVGLAQRSSYPQNWNLTVAASVNGTIVKSTLLFITIDPR